MGEMGMLIEGGTSATSDIILQQIDMLDIDPSRIKYMVLPHTHPDHVGAVPRIRRHWPHLKIVAGEVAAKFLSKDSFIKQFKPTDDWIIDILIKRNVITERPAPLDEYQFTADVVVAEGDTIDLGGGILWKVYHAPGHSPDHIALFEEKESTLTIGDITGYFDPDKNAFWPNYFVSLEEYCNSIRKLAALPAKRGLLSHNGVIEGDVNGYLKKAMKATETFHKDLLSRIDKGEDRNNICTERTDWVYAFAPLAPYKSMLSLNNLLCNITVAEREKDLFYFP
jgi:glyoxylase-like metal-dependent hydrolase (beta-lactamase superfamily II)